MAEVVIPEGTTHFSEGYGGEFTFYKVVTYPYLNQVAEEWQTRANTYYFDWGKWVDVGAGFSGHRCISIEKFKEYECKFC